MLSSFFGNKKDKDKDKKNNNPTQRLLKQPQVVQSELYHHDTGMSVLWDKNDSDYIIKQFRLVREAGRKDVANKFDERLHRRANDQTAYDDHANKYIEPLELSQPVDDLIVTIGLNKIAQLVTGETQRYFSDFASGTSTIPEARGDTALKAENARVSMSTSGYQTSSGSSMKFAGFFNTGFPSAVITEGGVFDDSTAGNMLFRTVYSSSLNHTQFSTVYTLTQSILQASISKVV